MKTGQKLRSRPSISVRNEIYQQLKRYSDYSGTPIAVIVESLIVRRLAEVVRP